MAGRKSLAGFHSASGLPVYFARVKGGAAGNLTVSGIKTDDTLNCVLGMGKYSGTFFLNTSIDFTSEFSISAADTINNTGGTATSDWVLLVSYNKTRE